jgi:hypothetical protein
MRAAGWLVVACCLSSSVGHAQKLDAGRAGVVPRAADTSSTANELTDSLPHGWLRARVTLSKDQRRALAPIASAVVPGAGQAMLGQQRVLAYVAVEAVAWWRYAIDVRDRGQQEARYKEVARRVARAQFSPSPPDSDWTYYEQMVDYKESGQYSLSTNGPVQPDTNPATFNGSRWFLARATSPTLPEALAQYERTAVKPQFMWSWSNTGLQYDIFKRYTAKRNDADQAATVDLMIIAANHVLSMVDAFTTMRLQVRAEADGRTSIGASVRW